MFKMTDVAVAWRSVVRGHSRPLHFRPSQRGRKWPGTSANQASVAFGSSGKQTPYVCVGGYYLVLNDQHHFSLKNINK